MAKKLNHKLSTSPKKVVYLIGSGATQAEASHQGSNINLLMSDVGSIPGIASEVLRSATKFKQTEYELERNIDIEKLISLLANTGIEKNKDAAEELRKLYFKVIVKRINDSGILNNPELAKSLLEMHNDPIFSKKSEVLSGIVNLNHDNLFQEASQQYHGHLNLGFRYRSSRYDLSNGGGAVSPLILHLHGAFNWENSIPIEVVKLNIMNAGRNDFLWIPPSILKESKIYPYTKLIGMAHELMLKRCDVLRIIGCSLSQNDWNIISLVFNTQYIQHHFNQSSFMIELIMGLKCGNRIKKEQCSYLQNMFTINELPYGDLNKIKERDYGSGHPYANPFKHWLIQKAKYHIRMGHLSRRSGPSTLGRLIEEG